MENKQCDCELYSKPIYNVVDDPHCTGAKHHCRVHGYKEEHFLIHTTKKDYCEPCKNGCNCFPKIPMENNKWEKEFDTLEVSGTEYGGETKDFIRQALTQQRKEIVEIAKGLRKEDDWRKIPEHYTGGEKVSVANNNSIFNQALDTIINKISNE